MEYGVEIWDWEEVEKLEKIVRLREMVIWLELLHPKVFNNKEVKNG